MARALEKIGDRLPNGWLDPVRQVGLFVLADLCYETVRGVADGRTGVAFANAHQIVSFEQSSGTFFEPKLQSILIRHQWIVDFANFMYQNSHFVLTTSFLVWLYMRRNETFYFVRNMFMIAMALALIGYALYPTAPPRLLAEYGFVDTITQFAKVNHDSALVQVFVNPYAAVPSMHCCFSLMIGVTGAIICRNPAAKLFWALYPALVFLVVVVTANHFWVDGAIGWSVAGVSALGAYQLARYRPAVWSFKPAEARTA